MDILQLLCRRNTREHSFIQNLNPQEELPCELYFQAPVHYLKRIKIQDCLNLFCQAFDTTAVNFTIKNFEQSVPIQVC